MRSFFLKMGLALALLAVLEAASSSAPPVKAPRPKFQEAVPRIDASFEPATARRGETIRWKLSIDLASDWYTYTALQVDEKAQAQRTRFSFPKDGDAVFVGQLNEPTYQTKAIPGADIKEVRYLEGTNLVWEHAVVVNPRALPGKTTIPVEVSMVVCSKSTGTCLAKQILVFETPLTISDEPPVEVESRYKDAVTGVLPSPELLSVKPRDLGTDPTLNKNNTVPPANGTRSPDPTLPEPTGRQKERKPASPISAETPEQYSSSLDKVFKALFMGPNVGGRQEESGLLAFILAGIFWGAVSLITPCVFPMIPITVSYFLKQSEKAHHRPVTMATVYCGTIIVVLAVAAVLLLSVFRMLSINPVMNIVMGLLFVFFAFSLFGWYDIELPSGLAQFTSAREGRGGLVGTMFMALTFTILSFACVAPFLGGFSGTAATGQFTLLERVLGGVAFAVTFASPFFVLALFPSLLKRLPKSGSWLNNVKVVMGFLELAAAFKFFRLSELLLTDRPSIFTFDLVMSIWVAISLLCGLYLLGFFRLPHDSPVEHLSVPRMLIGLVFVGLGFYLLPALFKSGEGEKIRPGGAVYAWVDSFLLPESSEGKLPWSGNLPAAIEQARAESKRTGQPKYVFIDFTGKSCTNCSINENTVFSRPEFKDLLGSYTLVQLYTDQVPNHFYAPRLRAKFGNSVDRQDADAAVNLDFQIKAFKTEQLPLYVILEPMPDGKVQVVSVYDEGKINNENAFARFLREPLEAAESATAQADEK